MKFEGKFWRNIQPCKCTHTILIILYNFIQTWVIKYYIYLTLIIIIWFWLCSTKLDRNNTNLHLNCVSSTFIKQYTVATFVSHLKIFWFHGYTFKAFNSCIYRLKLVWIIWLLGHIILCPTLCVRCEQHFF